MQSEKSSAFICLWLILLVIAGACIRVYGADIYHYHADELMHVQIAKADSLKQLIQFSLFETHPPLGHIIRYYWDAISDAPWFTRSLSLLFGLALIPLYYRIGKKLDNEFAGLCAAVLITFSRGCIIQSYVVRNYTIFLFFLSFSFYFYLRWRDERKNNALLSGYVLSALLAVFTHFSAILAIFCMAAYEIIVMYRDKTTARSALLKWIGANCLLAVVSALTYYIWSTSTAPVHAIANRELSALQPQEWILLLLVYPLHLLNYLLPDQYLIIPLAAFIPMALAQGKTFPRFFIPAAGALLLAIVLFAVKIYPFAGNRQELWLTPFLLPLAACIIAEGVSSLTAQRTELFRLSLVVATTLLLYNPSARFNDSLEYAMTETKWKHIQDYLRLFGKDDLLISGRTDALMLAPPSLDIYDYMGDTPSSVSPLAALIPYYNTHLLFNNRYQMRIYDDATLISMIEGIKDRLGDYNNLVFVNTYLKSDPMVRLITCPTLDKQVISFPPVPASHVFSKSEMGNYQAVFAIVKKQNFFDEVLSAQGKAHSCLNP